MQAQVQQFDKCFHCPPGLQGLLGPQGRSGPRGMRGSRGHAGMPGRDGQPGFPGQVRISYYFFLNYRAGNTLYMRQVIFYIPDPLNIKVFGKHK